MAVTRELALRQMAEPPKDREQIAMLEFEAALNEMGRVSRRVIAAIVALRDLREPPTAKHNW